MVAYLIRRVIGMFVLLFLLTLAVFFLFNMLPGDPARLTCGKNCTPQVIEANRKFLGFDKPITVQYANFMKGLVVERTFPDDPVFARNNPDKVTRCPAPCTRTDRSTERLRMSSPWEYDLAVPMSPPASRQTTTLPTCQLRDLVLAGAVTLPIE